MAFSYKADFHLLCPLTWDRLSLLKGLLFTAAFLYFNQYSASALTQSHQGSAPTDKFMLNATSPDARIQISSSTTVYVVDVEPPRESVTSSSKRSVWKVSLELLAMQLCEPASAFNGDRLKVINSNPNSIKATTWKANASYSISNSMESFSNNGSDEDNDRELTNIQANQIVLIPEGRWILSEADLIATLYQDSRSDGSCPEDTFQCSCFDNSNIDSLEETYLSHVNLARCIPKSLVCNGNPNCGFGCKDDESESVCKTAPLNIPKITSCVPPEAISTTVKTPLESGGVRDAVPKATVAVVGLNALIMIFSSRMLL